MKPLTLFLLLLGIFMPCHAQSGGAWSITSSTLDGGGGRSSGGAWVVTGTIGQPDASNKITTAPLTLHGGFWPTIQIISNGGPPLKIQLTSATNYILRWDYPSTGWRLQHSTTLQTWTDTDMSSRVQSDNEWQWAGTIPAGTPKLFFRLAKP